MSSRNPKLSHQFVDDKDIYDLLMSNRRQPSDDALRAMARRRGIILSAKLPREELARFLSRLTYSYPQLSDLLERSVRSPSPPKSMSMDAEGSLDAAAKAVAETKEQREKERGEVHGVTRKKTGLIEVVVKYHLFDWGKTRLRQVRDAECRIEIETNGSMVRVRYDNDDRAKEIVDDLLSRFEAAEAASKRLVVSLRGVPEPEKRTEFFVKLLDGIAGYALEDVTKVSVRRVPGASIDDDDEEEEEDGRLHEDDLKGFVKKAALDGTGLLNSAEFHRLRKDGFFISRAVWVSRQDGAGPLRPEFEATFIDGEECGQFAYRLRGVYRRNDETQDFNKTRAQPTPTERSDLTRLLEGAAHAALAAIGESEQPPDDAADDEGAL